MRIVGMVLVVALALCLRLPELGNRPMHADEAVHALKFRELYEKGTYRYDPDEFHGPTIYYAALPVVALRGRADFAQTQASDYRLATALFGVGMILLLPLLADAIGWPAVLIAAAFLALSPAFVFYSRCYIQETPLAFFTLGWIVCLWRYGQKPALSWSVCGGVCAGLMLAGKETAALTFAAALVALVALRVSRAIPALASGKGNHARRAALSTLIAVSVAALVISGFGTNPAGPLDYLRSYMAWMSRAQGTALHRQPWHYYLSLLFGPHWQRGGSFYSEGMILLPAIVGIIVPCVKRAPTPSPPLAFVRFLSLYTVALTVIYSVIPYKTPWCALSFHTGFCLLAGVGAMALWQGARHPAARTAMALLLLVGTAHLGLQAYRADFVAFADPRNPYVYSPTAPEAEEMAERIAALCANHPDRERMVIKVFSTDGYYWPLPWYLRRFPNVGYWTKIPADADAPVIVASPEFEPTLTPLLSASHRMTGFYGLRSGVTLQVWVRKELWSRFLSSQRPADSP